jgi:hypothetical protein
MEIRRRASVRAAHREVRSYSTVGVKFPCATRLNKNFEFKLNMKYKYSEQVKRLYIKK